MLTMRCFFLVIFSKLLFPMTNIDITRKDVVLTKDLNNFGNIDWCKAIVDDCTWDKKKDKTTKSINVCTAFLLVSNHTLLQWRICKSSTTRRGRQ